MEHCNPPMNFGGLSPHLSAIETSRVLIWPVPYERTVSYGSGTASGPAGIIEASRYVEFYDEELDLEPADIGIHTLAPADASLEPKEMMDYLHGHAQSLLATGKFLCVLGGEHSISPPLVRASQERFQDLSVLQIDAHADLRSSYEGTPWSHACAMRRIVEICPAVQVGIRSISREEARDLPTLNTRMFYAKDIVGCDGWIEDVIGSLSANVYVTLDVDGLDPSLVPFTGTPEPGGLLWYQTLSLLRRVAASRRVVGMDVVELCSPPGSAASSFLVSKLVYKMLGYIFDGELRARAAAGGGPSET